MKMRASIDRNTDTMKELMQEFDFLEKSNGRNN